MNDYITESMARIGCGLSDVKDIASIIATLPEIAIDTLDAMYNFGFHTTLTSAGSKARADLISDFSDDDLVCLSTYVNAYRNSN